MNLKKILVLEDEKDLLFNMLAYFDDEGFDCIGITNAEEALETLASVSIDVAIVDIELPKMNGEDFIALAKEQYPNLKFIIHTGQSNFVLSEELKKMKIQSQHIFRKPVLDYTLIAKELLLLTN